MSSARALVIVLTVLSPLAIACSGSSDGVAVPGGSAPGDTIQSELSANTTTTTEPATSSTAEVTTTGVTTTLATTTSEPAPVTTAERTVTLLRRGDEGPRVELVQLKLIALGYLPVGSDTGVFDDATNSAVLTFQSEYGLVVDGLIGPETERSISAAAESVNPEG